MSATTSGGQRRRRRRRRRIVGRAVGSSDCGEKDAFVNQLLCRDGVKWETPGCGRFGDSILGSSRSLGLPHVSAGLSAATGVVLLLLLVVLVGWYRRCAMLRRLGRAPAMETVTDPERPLRSSLKQSRKQRRIQRLLRLRRQRVRFNEAVNVNEFLRMSGTTLTSTSEGRPAPRLGGRGRHGSIFVSGRGQDTSDDDGDREEVSGQESGPHPGTSTDDDKNK